MTELRDIRLQALERANEVRSRRAEVKRLVQSGRLRLTDLLEHPPACCQAVPVFDAIQWARGIGPSKARRCCCRGGGLLSETLPLSALSESTRLELVARLYPETGVPR